MSSRFISGVSIVCAACLVLAGCSSKPPARGEPTPAANQGSGEKTAVQALACLGGGIGAGFMAKALAASEAKRLKLSAAEASKRERGYVIGFAVIGCGGAAALAGTAYSKLSADGKRQRDLELQEAATSARPRTYKDPGNPQLIGTATPQAAYQDPEKGRECRDIIDHLADAGQGEPIVVKYCRNLSGGSWAPVTA